MRFLTAFLFSVAAVSSVTAETRRSAAYETLTVVLGGDLGLGGSGQPVDAAHAVRHGDRTPVATMAAGLADVLKGDVVFANLESVVTENNDLGAVAKTFNFRSHPDAVRKLLRFGFNVFSTANNHAIDYGPSGIADTVRHLAGMKGEGLAGAPGTGIGRHAALAPATVGVRGARVLVSALGIGGPGTGGGAGRPAMASYQNDADFRELGFDLRDAEGDLRILSVHYGAERVVRPSASDERRLRDAVENFDLDLVAGHHSHVAAGVQDIGGRLIFYGLGNLMHPGMQDMDKFGLCRDFGVVARVHFGRMAGERFAVRAVEVFALADMQVAPKVRTGDEGRARIAALNHLAGGLDDASGEARGVRFTPQADGSGLYCRDAAAARDDSLARRCRATIGFAIPAPSAAVVTSCGKNEPLPAVSRAAALVQAAPPSSGGRVGEALDPLRMH